MCSRSSITMPSLVVLGFHPPPGQPKTLSFFVCLSVCPSVCSSHFSMSEIVRPISPWRRWSTETMLIPLDRGRFVVVRPCSTFSDCCQLATPLNTEVQKVAKIGVFLQPQDDRINWSRPNCTGKRIPWVCYRTLNLALIGKRVSVQELPKWYNGKGVGVGPKKLKFLLRFDQNVEYKRPAGAYPLGDFHKICRVCASFQDALGVKISLNLRKGLWSYGGFKLRGSG